MRQHIRAYRDLRTRDKVAVWSGLATVVGTIVALITFINPQDVSSEPAPTPAPVKIVEQNSRGTVNTPIGTNTGTVNITNQIGGLLPPNSPPAAAAPAPGTPPVSETYINNGGSQVNKPSAPVTINHYETQAPKYPEPTSAEMKGAILDEMAARGGKRTESGGIAVENVLAGAAVDIVDFEKIECVPAEAAAGYVCDYNVTTQMHMYSTDGSAAGAAHAQAWDNVLKAFTGSSSSSRSTGRFIKTERRWMLAGNSQE